MTEPISPEQLDSRLDQIHQLLDGGDLEEAESAARALAEEAGAAGETWHQARAGMFEGMALVMQGRGFVGVSVMMEAAEVLVDVVPEEEEEIEEMVVGIAAGFVDQAGEILADLTDPADRAAVLFERGGVRSLLELDDPAEEDLRAALGLAEQEGVEELVEMAASALVSLLETTDRDDQAAALREQYGVADDLYGDEDD